MHRRTMFDLLHALVSTISTFYIMEPEELLLSFKYSQKYLRHCSVVDDREWRAVVCCTEGAGRSNLSSWYPSLAKFLTGGTPAMSRIWPWVTEAGSMFSDISGTACHADRVGWGCCAGGTFNRSMADSCRSSYCATAGLDSVTHGSVDAGLT